jgi:hypothetical protein
VVVEVSFDRGTGRDRYFAVLAREVGELVDPAAGLSHCPARCRV